MGAVTGSEKGNSKTGASKYASRGVAVAAVGFALLVLGALMVLKSLSVGTLVTELFVLLGMFLLIVGCGTFGFAWAGDWPAKTFSVASKWSVVATFVSTVLITFMALWAYTAGNALWTAVSVGALGGLVHEIAQSKGTAFLPGSSNSQAAPAKPKKAQVPAQNPPPAPAPAPLLPRLPVSVPHPWPR